MPPNFKMMLQSFSRLLLPLSCLALCASASNIQNDATVKAVNISSPDGSAHARFINIGPALVNFRVKDKKGVFRDIIIGFDNLTEYTTAAAASDYFGPVVGRYANRIRNGTFTIPISKDASGPGTKFQIVENENNGMDTLHGGSDGFNSRFWDITETTSNSVTFSLLDPDGMEGFPGNVFAVVTYTLENESTWNINMHALADQETPIMLSSHDYWNFEAYQESQDLDGHFLQFPSTTYVETDGILIPTGELGNIIGTPLDFNKARSIGAGIKETAGKDYCGTNCVGFDNCWIYDRQNTNDNQPILSLWSVNSGIRLDVTTNQVATQVYTCNGIPDIPRKADQGVGNYTEHSCVVLEQQSYIDAINHPSFGINQIYGPNRPYDWQASYKFSVLKD